MKFSWPLSLFFRSSSENIFLDISPDLMTKEDYESLDKKIKKEISISEKKLRENNIIYTPIRINTEWYYDGSGEGSICELIYHKDNSPSKKIRGYFSNFDLYLRPHYWYDFDSEKERSYNIAYYKSLQKLLNLYA